MLANVETLSIDQFDKIHIFLYWLFILRVSSFVGAAAQGAGVSVNLQAGKVCAQRLQEAPSGGSPESSPWAHEPVAQNGNLH